MSKKALSNLFQRWSNRGRAVSADLPARYRARLRLEEVEQRVVPATLPPVTASDTRVIAAGAFAPQAVTDPTNPNTIVVVSGSTASGVGVALNGQISRDGGQTWTSFGISNPDTGVNAGPGGTQLTNVNTPSVAFSRTGDLYVVWTSTTADFTTAGRLRVASFTVQQSTPALGNGVTAVNSALLYQWLNQDPVYNPTVAVNNNVDEFTDPDTGLTSAQDTMLGSNKAGKAVYVAWNTNARTPTVTGHTPGLLTPFTPNAIFAAATRDKGATWSTPVPVNNGGFVTGSGGVAPQIRFTPGDLNSSTVDVAGRLQFLWTTPGGTGRMDVSRPDGGNLANEVTTVYSATGGGGAIFEPGLDANSGPDITVNSDFTINVNIDNSATSTNGAFFSTLRDIDVTVAAAHPHLNQLTITLIPPAASGLPSINLLANRTGTDGNIIVGGGGALQGLPDNGDTSGASGLGRINNIATGTVFSSEAARLIHDPANSAPYIAHFRPEYGNLAALYGATLAQLNGTWTLRIVDSRDDDRNAGFSPGLPIPNLNFWSMRMSSLISNAGFGTDSSIPTSGAFGATLSNGANLGGGGASNTTALGIGTGASYAYDNTLGSFSPFSGRMYVAYTAQGFSDNAEIWVRYSDDQGVNWSDRIRVIDDSSADNFSEGNRSQFQPSITVDPVTGTVVLTWYDARWDASNARVATYIATSIDGGDTWSVQDRSAYLNNTKNATDQVSRSVIGLEPIPTNLRAIGVMEAGQRQSVLAYGGQIKPFWTGNENAAGGSIYTATVATSAGPRVVDNDTLFNTDQGAVTADAGGYNDTFTNDGTRRIDGFIVTFDRLVNTASFNTAALLANPDLVKVFFRAPGTERQIAATLIPLSAIIALDPVETQTGFASDATRFFVQFATPQSAAGTYSYVVGPYASDRIRSQRQALFTPPETPTAIPDLEMIESTISVPVLAGSPAPVVQNMQVMVDITHTFTRDLRITLFGPDPDGPGPASPLSIILSNRNGGGGDNYRNTRFNDAATSFINAGPPFASAPFTGVFKPEQPLGTFNGTPMAGNWTLRVEDLEGGDIGILNAWSITFLDPAGNPITVNQSGTFMDQDGDSRTREIGTNYVDTIPKSQQAPLLYTDAYTVPGSSGKNAFNEQPLAAAVDPDTLPLISTGPHMVLVGSPNERAIVSFATRDAFDPFTLHVTLDRAVDVTTFDPSDVIAVVNAGTTPITGTFTIVPTNEANEIASQFDFVYTTPLPTGTYSVSLGTNFVVADGMFRNTTNNQLLVRFDRDIDPATFTPANVLRITGPIGDIADVQDIAVTGTAGTFTVTFDNGSGPQTTAALPYNVAPSGGTTPTDSLQNALAALPNIGAGNVVVTLETSGNTRTYHVTFTGGLRSNQPIMTSVGAGGAAVTVTKGITVTPVATTFNAVTGGARAFIVTYPTQQLSGPYNIEFGQDPFGNSIRAVAVPQLVTVLPSATNTIQVTFNRDIGGGQFVHADILRVLGPNGSVSLAGLTLQQDSARTFSLIFPSSLPAGQYVVDFNDTRNLYVAGSGPAIDMNFNAGLDTLRGDAPASNDLDPRSFPSTASVVIPPAGPDGTGSFKPSVTESIIVVSEDYIIRQSSLEQIRLLLNISHPDVRDLTIDLVPPDATGVAPIRLFTGSLTTNTSNVRSANFSNTLLVDRVNDPNVTNIQNGLPPFLSGGSFYSPQTPLSALVGKSSKGVWTLRVTNTGTNTLTSDPGFTLGNPIRITNWTLTLPKALTVQTQRFDRTSAVPILPGTPGTPVESTSTIFIPVDFTITETTLNQIQMLMNISHPNVRNLDIDLIPPAATGVLPIRLFTGSALAPTAPNQTANFTNTRLVNRVNDPNAPSLQTAIPPFNAGEAGFFSPQNALTALIGKSTFGTWTLRVTNRGSNAPTSDPNFTAGSVAQITNWSLTFPRKVATTGLGEATADRFQASFRIFTQDPTNTLTQTTWTPVGPAPTNETANAARISAMAVDPTDPTGNTVYVAVAGGGIWKTTDFLNNSSALQNGGLVPRGPSYVPLTDFGPTSAVNVSSIAVFPRNNDPHQTIILALTGEPSTQGKMPGSLTSSGVGVLRSLDGGRTWQVLDSTTNVDAQGNVVLMSDQNIRNHLFVGATGYKILVDPTPGKDGGVIVYMALSGNANQNGLWRSLNGGNTWTRVMAGNATDVVLAAGSANLTDPATGKTVFQGNLQQLYAAFRNTPVGSGPGVYKTDSAPAALSLDFMAGGTNNPLIRDISITGSPQITTNLPASTPNSGNRISLAVPALTGEPLKDSFLKDWLYALTTDGTGAAQLYVTKDAGAHWTLVRVPNLPTLPDISDPSNGGATNNESTEQPIGPLSFVGRAQVSVDTTNDYNMAIIVDPSDPNIVYMAGEGIKSIRLDLTKMRDAHNFTFYNNSNALNPIANASNSGFTTQVNINNDLATVGGLQPRTAGARGGVRIGGTNSNYVDENNVRIGFLNLFGGRDYNQPFTTNSLVRVVGTGDEPITQLAGSFVNDGTDISWSPFEDIFDPNVPDQTGSFRTQNRFSGINTHAILSFVDPVTGKTRLLMGTDDGVFTGVDSGSTIGRGTLSNGIGFSETVNGSRNGNLQVSQFWSGAVQPSQLAADLAGALFYGMGDQSGFPVSSPNILSTGDLNWRGPTGDGVSVLVDQAGSGTAFQYRSPGSFGFDLNATASSLDFFRVLSNTSDHAFGGGFSRTGSSSGSLFDQPGEIWRSNTASLNPVPNSFIPQPNANPANPNVLLFGSTTGRIYRSTDQGVTWVVKGQQGDFDSTQVLSVAFGASDPAQPTLVNNFLYAGTNGGRVYSTTTGGSPWTLIGSNLNGLSGTAILRVIPNPQVGKKDVFVLTTNGIFYKADGTTAAGNWINKTGNLFNLTRSVFGNDADQDPALKANSLTALAVDWRYAFPDPSTPGATFPILYVAGDGGVFRTVDNGTTWTFFPDVANNGAPADGGYLPNTHITDLDLSIGDLDPNTGRYKAGGLNMLVATTYGRGTWAIRLDPNLPESSFISGPRVIQLINPNPVGGPSSQLNVRFSGPVDPATFTPQDIQLIGPGGPITVTSVNLISTTDANGVNPRDLYSITFPTQFAVGSYDIVIGYNPTGGDIPLISDPSGFLMNQDNDTINGEPVVDQYRNTILLNSSTNNRLVVAQAPATATAGQSNSVRIEARDANDLLLNGVSGTLTLSPAPGTGTFTPSTATLVNGVATFTVIFQTAGPQTVNVAFSAPPTINATAWTTTVIAGAATQLVLSPPSSTLTAGDTQPFTLTAQDQFGNTATTYNQTVSITSTGVAATLPGSVVLTNGTANFDGVFNTSGNVQITATGPDPSNPPSGTISGSANVTVSSGTATHISMSISAGPYSVGSTATLTVTALDAFNNIASNLNGTSVTVGVIPDGTTTITPASPVFVNGVATFTATFTAAGTFVISATANGPLTASVGPITVTASPPPPSPTDDLTGIYGVGSGVGGSPVVNIYNGDGTLKTTVFPFPPGFGNEVDPAGPGFLGGNRVAVGDVTGDSVPDYIIGSGPTITATVLVFNGATGKQILTYRPFEDFKGGVFVSVGDITGDGVNDIAITPDEGGGPRVTVLRGGDFFRIANFFGINDPDFRGGARPAIGDINGDGFSELVVSAGFGGGPRISVFDGAALAKGKESHPVGDFFLFEPQLRNGAYIAVGDVDGDGFGDLIGGAGPGGGPRVLVISGKKLLEAGPDGPLPALAAPIANFFGGDIDNRGGIRVAAKNIDGDRNAEIITGSGATDVNGNLGGSTVSVYLGVDITANNYTPLSQFDLIPGYFGGVFVG